MHFIRFADFPLTNGLVLISLLKVICSATHPSPRTKCQRKQLCFVHQSRERRVGSHSAFPAEKCLWPTATPLAHAMQWGPRSRPRGQITGLGYWVYLRDLCIHWVRLWPHPVKLKITQESHGVVRQYTKLTGWAEFCVRNHRNVALEHVSLAQRPI